MNIEHLSQLSPELLAVRDVLQKIEQATVEYSALMDQVGAHRKQIASARAALGAIYAQIEKKRQSVREWDRTLWNVGWKDSVSPERREYVQRQLNTLDKLLDGVFWSLGEFRGKGQT
jgi:hypothetical protein